MSWPLTPDAVAAVEADVRWTDAWVELILPDGTSGGDLPVDSVRVTMSGEQAETWSHDMQLSDPALVPTSTASPLDGRAGMRARVWWRVSADGVTWWEVPCGTTYLEDPRVTDAALGGTPHITVTGRDPLAVARRGKYGAQTVSVGGLTVDVALTRLFAAVAPGLPVSVASTATTLPPAYALWARDPAQDWTEIAAMAGWVVRSDRMGTIVCGPAAAPTAPVCDWQEGSGCPVTDLTATMTTSTIPRAVVVVSTSPDVTPVIVGRWINPDADTSHIITEQRVESDAVTSQAAADALARLTGERWARPQQAVQVKVPARPDLDYRDLVSLGRARAAVAGGFRVSSWSFTMAGRDTAPVLMEVTMMTRQADA